MDHFQLTPQMQAMLRSPEAKQLMALLGNKDHSAFKQAAAAAQTGDTETVKRTLAPLLQDPKVAQLLTQLTGGR